jgi:AraC family transcriptional regulator of adaptative response/methylated-DNA-[protein]-cysteine methyltransferase
MTTGTRPPRSDPLPSPAPSANERDAATAAVADRRAAPGVIHLAIGPSSLGLVLVARSDRGMAAVLIGDDHEALRRELRARFPGSTLDEGDGESLAMLGEVIGCIERPGRALDVPLDLGGTEFQRTVWRALREIPSGTTTTYTEIAVRLGRPKSARAVAQACAANALAVVVPCHRVVRRDGSLSGYRWGVQRKRALLDSEAMAGGT